jgi:hypothetical protein
MNKQNAHFYLPLIQALAEGKTIEFQTTGDDEKWVEMINVSFGPSPHKYRVKPEPVMVPLGPEDVPPGSAIRGNAQHWFMVTDMENYGVKVSGRDSLMDWAELQGYWEIKRPGEDWMPCHKPA